MISTAWTRKYTGIPFISGGRDIAGLDCWGLVRLVYKEEHEIELPSYGEISARELTRIADRMEQDSCDESTWLIATRPRQWDVVAMRWFSRPQIGHVGLVVTPGTIMHIEEGTDVVVVPVDHHTVRGRIARYHRHRRLT